MKLFDFKKLSLHVFILLLSSSAHLDDLRLVKWFKIIVFQCLQKRSGIRNDCILWERGFCV